MYMKKENTRRMNEEALRKKLHDFIDKADDNALQALDDFIDDTVDMTFSGTWWEDNAFMAEMKRRWKEYVQGGKAYTHEEAMEMARKAIKSVKRKPA